MRHKRFSLVSLTVVTVCALIAQGIQGAAAMHSTASGLKGNIVIGQVTSLTGPYSVYGIMEEQGFHVGLMYATHGTMKVDGARLVVKEYNDVAGSANLPDPATAVTQAKNAIENDHAQILQCCASTASALAVAPIAAQYKKILMVAPASGNPLSGINRYTFRTSREDAQDAIDGAKYAKQQLGKSYMFMAQDYAFGHDQGSNWTTYLNRSGAKDVGDIYFPLTATDFTPYIQQIVSKKPDFLVVACAGTQCLGIWKQFSQQGLFDQVKVMTGLPNVAAIPFFGDAASRMAFISVYYYKFPHTRANNYLVAQIQKLYKRPADIFDQDAFAAAQQIVAALQKTHSTSSAKLIKALEGQTVQGPKGPYTIRKQDHVCLQPMYITKLTGSGSSLTPVLVATKSAKATAPPVQAHNW